MEKQPSPHTASSMIRNITIGVVTPVIAATIIYFLGFNRGDSNADFKKKKEATINVWKGYILNRNILLEVLQKQDSTLSEDEGRNNFNHEVSVTADNMENVKKEPNADQKVYSTIDITVQQIREMKTLMDKSANDIIAYYKTNASYEQKKAFSLQRHKQFSDDMNALGERDKIRLDAFYDELNKDYDIQLPRH